MCKCCIKKVKFNIDHIRSLANGGTNDIDNLQPLCLECHMDKTSTEHEQGKYVKLKDSESSFNTNVQEIMDSPLSQTHAFCEPVFFGEIESDKKIFCIDINKCRKNILHRNLIPYCGNGR
jgi:hypothetical protein